MILAGGISPQNAEAGLRRVRPFGIDSCTRTNALDADGRRLDATTLPARLASAAAQTPQPELQLRADRDTRYQQLAEVMSQARAAGIEKMGFITQPDTKAAER